MANWLIVVDEDKERRDRYVEWAEASIAPFDGLDLRSVRGQGWSITWAAGMRAPVRFDFDSLGGAVVWGEPRDEAGNLQVPHAVMTAWRGGATEQWDGYFSAAVVDERSREVIVGTDLLGIWPVYYWTNGKGVSLVGSSPQLFRGHEAFRAEIDIDGLIGIFLTNGMLDNRSLWKDVRRLTPGNRVRVTRGRLHEDTNYRVPVDIETVDMPFRGHVRQLDTAIRNAVSRHAPGGRGYGLMLSGGLDSRLLAGFLSDQRSDTRCITFGKSRDFEMRGARAVARNLGLEHIAVDIPAAGYSDAAIRLAHWEVLGAGFSGVPEWGMFDILAEAPGRLVVGHVFDGIVGGIHIGWAYDSETRHMGLDVLLPTIHAWGLNPIALKELVGDALRPQVDSAMDLIRATYDNLAPREHHRAWLFDLQHRQRFHVGSALWPISFASWPVVPFLDRDVVRVCAAMPSSSLADRRVQFGLLESAFPNLAALPLDRNSWDDMPHRPRLRDFIRRSVNYRLHGVQRAARRLAGKEMPDRVYYHRLYDFNSPGWRSVRELAEPCRDDMKRFLVPGEVDKILPPPDQAPSFANAVKDPSAARILMGLGMTTRYLASQ